MVFLGQNTYGEHKKTIHPPRSVLCICFTRPCMRTCSAQPCLVVAAGAPSRRAQMCGGMVLLESPRQSSLEMYHRRRHRATPGRGASLGARARSEAIWLLLARKKCLKNADEMLFAGTRNQASRLSRAPLPTGLARQQCGSDASSGCRERGSTGGAAALFTGNGPV